MVESRGGRSSSGEGAPESTVFSAIAGLQRLAEVFDLRRRQLAAEVGLSDGQWRLLEEIASEHFMPSLFARRRECSPAAVSRLLRQLQDKGLVRASISADDARKRAYTLTSRGRRVLDRLRESRRRALDAVWGGLPVTEIARFGQFSAELADRLEAYAAEVGEAPA